MRGVAGDSMGPAISDRELVVLDMGRAEPLDALFGVKLLLPFGATRIARRTPATSRSRLGGELTRVRELEWS